LIQNGLDFINNVTRFETPIYSTMIPTIQTYIGDLGARKELEFPAAELEQTTLHDFMHFRQ